MIVQKKNNNNNDHSDKTRYLVMILVSEIIMEIHSHEKKTHIKRRGDEVYKTILFHFCFCQLILCLRLFITFFFTENYYMCYSNTN